MHVDIFMTRRPCIHFAIGYQGLRERIKEIAKLIIVTHHTSRRIQQQHITSKEAQKQARGSMMAQQFQSNLLIHRQPSILPLPFLPQ